MFTAPLRSRSLLTKFREGNPPSGAFLFRSFPFIFCRRFCWDGSVCITSGGVWLTRYGRRLFALRGGGMSSVAWFTSVCVRFGRRLAGLAVGLLCRAAEWPSWWLPPTYCRASHLLIGKGSYTCHVIILWYLCLFLSCLVLSAIVWNMSVVKYFCW